MDDCDESNVRMDDFGARFGADRTLTQYTPGISERRAVYTILVAGRTRDRIVCATGMSLLCSGDSCGNARGRLS